MTVHILDRLDLPTTATAGATSTVGEPNVARRDDHLLYTGNWYAARSLDGGASWSHLDPTLFFPSANDGFCCDQTTLYDPSRQLFVWILQYKNDTQRNTLRLAVKTGGALDGGSPWIFWDLVPDSVDPAWTGEWFDYNHAALSDNFLYLVSNVFATDGSGFRRCVAFRFPLDELAAGGGLSLERFETSDFSLRCTQGATSTMYLGTHRSVLPQAVRVFAWPEASPSVSSSDVPVGPWKGGNGYFAPGPDGRNWLGRCDPRITAGWVSGGVVGFAWSVDRLGPRPQPHVHVVRIDEASMTPIDEPAIWHSDVAFAWADTGVDPAGDVGISLFFGGGAVAPSHAVGGWDDAAGRWELAATRIGTDGPDRDKWGDYVCCRPANDGGPGWLSSGYVLDGSGDLSSIRPFAVRHSR